MQPEIIFADEPSSALDPISSRVIEEEFIKLKSDYTIILVTHILRQAKRLADNVVFMYYGEIVESGPAEQIFENPQTEILKEYLRVGHFKIVGGKRLSKTEPLFSKSGFFI